MLHAYEISSHENSAENGFGSATSSSGDALVVWTDRGARDDYYDGGPVRARLARADGTLEPVQQISPDVDGAYVTGGHSAINASGAGVVVWTSHVEGSQNAESGRRVLMRGRSPSGALGLVIDIGETGIPLDVGIDDFGTVHVLVVHRGTKGDDVYALRRVSAAGVVQQEFELASGQDGFHWQHLRVSSSGRAVAIGVKTGRDSKIHARAVDRGGSIGPVTQVSPPDPAPGVCGADIDIADLAINEGGDAYVAWSLHGCSDDRVLGRIWKADGSLGETQTLAAGIDQVGSVDDRDPDASINAAGAAYVTWSDNGRVRGRLRHPDGSLSDGDLLTTGGTRPASTFDDRGRATVVWIDRADWTGRLYIQTLVPGGARGQLVSIQAAGDMLGLGTGPFTISTGADGNPLLLSLHWGGSDYDSHWIEGVRLARWAPTPPTQGDPPTQPPPSQPPTPTETWKPSDGPAVPGPAVATPRKSSPRVSARLSPRRLIARDTAHQRRLQRSAALVYRLSERGRVTIAVERASCGGATCRRLPVRRLLRTKAGGRYATSLDALLRGRALRPGRYRVALRLRTSTGAASRLTSLPFSVARSRSR